MRDQEIQALADQVRLGVGLKEAIKAAGLPVKSTLIFLRDSCKDTFTEAKEEARARAE